MLRDLRRFALTKFWTYKYWSIQSDVERSVKICVDKTLSVPILVHSMWCQEISGDLHWEDFESTNIGPFDVLSRDLWRFALTRLWTCKYWYIQSDVKRSMTICIDKTLNMPILIYSKWCQEICGDLYWFDLKAQILVHPKRCENLHRQDFECANIGLFNMMSRDLWRFALTRLWKCQYWFIQRDVKGSVEICIDQTLNVQISVYSMWCQEICEDLHWLDFESANIGSFNVKRFAFTRHRAYQHLSVQYAVKRSVEICID